MKITKSIKLLILGGIIVIGLNLTGCMIIEQPDIPDRFEVVKQLDSRFYEIRDKETGVHYFYKGNNGGNQCAISPVYLFNGQVKTTTDIEANKGEK